MRRLLILGAPGAVILLGVLIISVLIATAPEPKKNDEGARPIAVFVAPVETKDIRLSVSTQGEVRPRREIDLVPQVAGRIVYVAPEFVEGGIITAGQTLIRIEDSDFKLQLVRAEARVAQAQQALTREVAEGEMARRDWEELGEGQASPLTLREPQLAEAKANLAAAKADLEDARLALKRTDIRAPFTGRVREKAADIGQFVATGTRLGRIFSTDVAEIRLPLTDEELALLNLPVAFSAPQEGGPEVVLSAVVAGKPRQWQGSLVRTASAIDPQTRVLFAIAEVADPYGEGADDGFPLAMGLFVGAEIKGREIENAFVVPRAALRGTNQVYIVNDKSELEIRTVGVIDSSPAEAVLRDGVAPGERAVISPLREPRNGMALEILTDDPSKDVSSIETLDTAAAGPENANAVPAGENR